MDKHHRAIKALKELDWSLISQVKDMREFEYKPNIKYSKKAPFTWLHDAYCSSKLTLDSFCKDMEFHWDDFYDGPNAPKSHEITTKGGRRRTVYGIPVDGYSCVTKEHIEAFKKVIELHEQNKEFTHGMYLKSAAYSKKSGGDSFDYVFFDEAQDANFFMLKLLDKQKVKKLYFVGDERQSIYTFNLIVNVFKERHIDKLYTLSKSFRFGNDIAKIANKILHLNSNHTVEGTEQNYETNPKSIARLYRTNATLFKEALDCAYTAQQKKISLKIDLMKAVEDECMMLEILSFLKLYYEYREPALFFEYEGLFPAEVSPSLKNLETSLKSGEQFFDAYNELYDFLSDNVHSMFKYILDETRFIEKYIAYIHCVNNTDPNAIYLTFCTMHRSKGLEWDNVTIAEPTKLYYQDKDGVLRRNKDYLQELNLAYVAVTRARKTLNAEVLRSELSNERASFDTVSFKVKEGKLVELETKQLEHCNN